MSAILAVASRPNAPASSAMIFWLLLAALTAVTIYPVWCGPYAPLMDFGGHLSLLDAFVRLDHSRLLSSYLERNDGWAPNLLAARFAALLFPLIAPIHSLRLWITGGLLLQVLGLLWYVRTFDRSVWQVFICVPFMWSAPLVIGFVNFIPIVGLVFVGLCVGRRAGASGHWSWALAVAMLGAVSYFLHGIGYAFVVSLTALMIVVHASRPRHLLHLLALLPSLLLWVYWVRFGLAETEAESALDGGWTFFTPGQLIYFIRGDVLNLSTGETDLVFLWVFLGLWLVWMAIWLGGALARGRHSAHRPGGESEAVPAAASASRLGGMWRRLRTHSGVLAALTMCAFVVMLPVTIRLVAIGYRMMQPAAMAVLLIPRLPMRNRLVRVSVLATIVVAFAWAGFVNMTMQRYHTTESPALMEAVAHIRPGSRVACVNVGNASSGLHFRTMLHNCAGVVQVYADSFAGLDFAASGFNAVRYRDGRQFVQLPTESWERYRAVGELDYVLVRDDDGTTRAPHIALVDHEPARGGGSSWSLYRVITP